MTMVGTIEIKNGARQIAMWLKNATVGSFITMRHEYAKCKFCPKRLKDSSNKYIGPVYVVGVVTKKVMPGSDEEKQLKREDLREFPHYQNTHTFCRVDWKWIGIKGDLRQNTQNFLNKICQPTLVWICKDNSKQYADETTAASSKTYGKMQLSLCSGDFPDVFDQSKY